ncbi:MAG TPA: chemotaxis protein CheA [Gemmatimonadales bacterium]|nr:chemotaxis protein CheA [Gemmatimonadales bacterium]
MDRSQYVTLFLTESREHLGACNQLLVDWERDPRSLEPLTGIFRAVHSLKGMAATMGYARVAELAHRAENLLDALRGGTVAPSAEAIDLLFRVVDALETGVERAVAQGDAALDFSELVAALDRLAARREEAARRADEGPVSAPGVGRLVRVTVSPQAAMKGARAALALRRAEALGRVTGVRPAVVVFEQEDFDGRFSFRLESAASDAEVVAAIRGAGDIESVAVGGEPLEPGAPATAAVERARHIRVDLRRLDALMTRIGELAVAKGRLGELVARQSTPELEAVTIRIARLVNELQTEIMQARMTPVWQVFDRFPRLVRDLARQLGRQVSFRVEGEEIELDRSVLDEIGDPILHLLRNAVDHGIESPEERVRRGKPPEGRIVLAALRDRSTVMIRVSDDGRGIDRGRLLAKGIREGHLDPGTAVLTDDLLLKLLSRPGFSTAERVTDVSGRGVGIDVVASRVRALGGAVEIQSEEGRGTTFTLRLPMTLAVVRALLARVGGERYAVPLTHVAETGEFRPAQATAVGGRQAVMIRDRLVPTVHLRQLFQVPGEPPPVWPTIVVELGERRAALVVDALVGQQEIVVGSFEAPRGTPPYFSGATILGDGAPALILDAAALV